MLVLIDADILPWMISHSCVKEELVDLEDFKRKTDNYILAILQCVASNSYIMYLSGKDNFRFNIEAQKSYKGNRGKGEKPVFFNELRQYLVDTYKAITVDGSEADDYLCMSQIYCNENSIESCIASSDHDMLQIPGYHLNIRKLVVSEITKEEANYNFWVSVLTGCSTDQVAGIEGIGEKGAVKILDTAVSTIDYPRLVLDAYINKYGEELGLKWFKANYQLIRLITKNKHFKLPTIMNVDEVISKIVN